MIINSYAALDAAQKDEQMSNPNSRLFMTRMSHIEELKALDERIGSRAINQEERAPDRQDQPGR